ncbi:ATP-binding protein [Arthrobacter zhangbolii]|uniref:Histidine kinase/HSP90-like ATPase domain-containing protein n=1 Tax=Arthrobacter zhangbolii TaxID=2886936 RepID=A0A9X1M9L2_9MICC|nr:hypothetical protein [Arthrobacter zhangbolii]
MLEPHTQRHRAQPAGRRHGTTQGRIPFLDRGVLTVETAGRENRPELVSTFSGPFQRGTERNYSDLAGVGLGLTIVNRIMHAHDGILTITPRSEAGIRVSAQLPAPPRSFAGHRTTPGECWPRNGLVSARGR